MRKTVQTLRFLLAGAGLALAAGCATTPEAVARDYPARPEVRAFIDGLAERHAFDRAALDEIFARVRRSDAAIRLMTPAPPSFKRSWKVYRSRFIDDTRISAGVRFWREHEDTVARASERYGVPEEIIVAIIGVETVFGRITGDHRVIDVLTTLAFDYPRRADYFRSELEQYLLLTRTEGVDPFAVRGSYAGAIGLPQFMPGSIRRWAVDFDGDGRIDLRESPADAIGSLRNYGVSSRDPVAFDTKLALIDLPNGDDAPDYWLGARNFYVITRYNRSSFYASAVIELAEALRGEIGR